MVVAGSWLTADLPRHPIFTLPDDTRSSGLSELARPPSPNVSAILPARSTPTKPANNQDSPFASLASPARSLFGDARATPRASDAHTRQQSVYSSTITPTSSSKRRQAPQLSQAQFARHGEKRDRSKPARTATMVVCRGSELIIAVGHELRITNLQDVKSKSQQNGFGGSEASSPNGEPDETDLTAGDYKTLYTPAIDFDILQIVVNPTSKLLAVVGTHSVAVVVLPRKGWSSSVSKTIECRSLLVGRFYHHLPGSLATLQVMWHPWGEHASSLLVLSSDATVREYNVAQDVDEPIQSASFNRALVNSASSNLATSARNSSSSNGRAHRHRGFSAIDQDAETAVGFCLGSGKGDWGPATLYGLMKNGDIKALCPFLPKKASIPASWIHALSSFVSTKMDYLVSTEAAEGSASLALSTLSKTHVSPEDGGAHSTLTDLYNQQLQYVNHLIKQASHTSTTSPDSMDVDVDDESIKDVFVRIVSPTHLHPQGIAPQGPLLMQPEPVELEIEEVGMQQDEATSLQYVSYDGSSSAAALQEEDRDVSSTINIGAIIVAFKSGRVDVCIEVEKVEARWAAVSKGVAVTKSVTSKRHGTGYGVTFDENGDDDDDAGRNLETPTLIVYEMIDLGLLDLVRKQEMHQLGSVLERNYPVIVSDTMYNDTVYVQHAFGAHCLCLSSFLEAFSDALTTASRGGDVGDEAKQINKVVDRQLKTDVVWILQTIPVDSSPDRDSELPSVEGLYIVNDVYLGYSVFLLTSSLQFVGIEMPLRIDSSVNRNDSRPVSTTSNDTTRAYVSLLDEPFQIPTILTKRSNVVARVAAPPSSSRPSQPLSSSSSSSNKELVITPVTLRYLGQQVETFQTGIRDLVGAVDQVQSRIELQVKELARQLDKVQELKRLYKKNEQQDDDAHDEVVKKRLNGAKTRQDELMARVDKLLQTLMNQHHPTLSSFEQNWFDELDMFKDVYESSVKLRAERVESKVRDLEPSLKEMKDRQAETHKEVGVGKERLGQTQVKVFEVKLAQE
ncbi:hypothetical protein OIV83_002337 [Microbotryomycetes sp. JL201]|nr:hypothetical protein OIV83_002337 [Microbotryomycetes sp. JL201]